MMARGSRNAPQRYLFARASLGFFGAGVWLAGMLAGNSTFTGAAIGILLVAVVLGWIARYQERRERQAAEYADVEYGDPDDTTGQK
ncbi:MAG: hypothetical protein LBG44_06165 [Gemmatimonadota bacterium]|jgi:ABC-type branched-subunit amino acid transport system permease subunit|nr:hypothetical protein [Gemmatimonadota bacterium]